MVAGQTGRPEVDKTALDDVRFGSKADILRCGKKRHYSITHRRERVGWTHKSHPAALPHSR
jgi:hypothetical protein